MTAPRGWALGAAGFAAAIAVGCGGPQVTMPDGGPRTAAELRAQLNARPVKTLQGTGRLDAYVGADRRSVTVLVGAARPASLQLQALTPTLDLVALWSTDGGRFLSFERGGDRCLTGRACPRNLARLLPLPLPAEGLVAALLGEVPWLDAADEALQWDAERGLYRIERGRAPGWVQHVFVAPGGQRPVGAVWYRGGARIASLQYDGELASGGPPKVVRVKAADPPADLTLSWRDVRVDAPIDAEFFAVACPDGMTRVELPCEPE